jgi:hypothetical protein
MKNSKQELSQQHRISLKKHDLFKNNFLTVEHHKSIKSNTKSPLSTSIMSRSGCYQEQQPLSNHLL